MPRNIFTQRKKSVLGKIDKSFKGDWDKKIISLCKKINSMKNYYTTSSCSGRIVLIIDKDKKQKGLFLKVYHNKITFKKLKRDLREIVEREIVEKSIVKFKQEPCILHIVCKTLKNAETILKKAHLAGWKKSGILSIAKNRIIVELNGTDRLEFLILNKRKILVTGEFLELIVKKSNENLEKSWEKIEKLKDLLK